MKRIATTTIIRGNGACEAYMNGIVNEEIEKMKDCYEEKLSVLEAKLQSKEDHLDNLLTDRLIERRAMFAKPTSIIKRIRERIVITWCQIWGLCFEFKLITDNEE